VFQVRFLADLVNTRVIPPLSIMTLFNNLTEVIHESRIPQVWYDGHDVTVSLDCVVIVNNNRLMALCAGQPG